MHTWVDNKFLFATELKEIWVHSAVGRAAVQKLLMTRQEFVKIDRALIKMSVVRNHLIRVGPNLTKIRRNTFICI